MPQRRGLLTAAGWRSSRYLVNSSDPMDAAIILTGDGNIATAVKATQTALSTTFVKPVNANHHRPRLLGRGAGEPKALSTSHVGAIATLASDYDRVYEVSGRNASETARRLNDVQTHLTADFGQTGRVLGQVSSVEQ